MNFKDTLEDCLMVCPSIFPNALTVYDHLFLVIGNGYDWVDGELVSRDEYSLGRKHTVKEAIAKQISFYFLNGTGADDYVEGIVDRVNSIDMDFAKRVHKINCEQVIKYIDDVLDTETRAKDFSFETADKAFCRVCSQKYKLYGLSGYSKLANLPDDIKDDWLEAAEKMYEILDKQCEINSDRVEGSLWIKLPTIKERIDELKAKRTQCTGTSQLSDTHDWEHLGYDEKTGYDRFRCRKCGLRKDIKR